MGTSVRPACLNEGVERHQFHIPVLHIISDRQLFRPTDRVSHSSRLTVRTRLLQMRPPGPPCRLQSSARGVPGHLIGNSTRSSTAASQAAVPRPRTTHLHLESTSPWLKGAPVRGSDGPVTSASIRVSELAKPDDGHRTACLNNCVVVVASYRSLVAS